RGRRQRQAGWTVEEISGTEARGLEPALWPDVSFALHFPHEYRCDNRKLTQAYAAAAVRAGVEFREGVQVDTIETRGGRAAGARLHDGSRIEADLIVNAAGAWAGKLRGLEHD